MNANPIRKTITTGFQFTLTNDEGEKMLAELDRAFRAFKAASPTLRTLRSHLSDFYGDDEEVNEDIFNKPLDETHTAEEITRRRELELDRAAKVGNGPLELGALD